MEVGFLMAEDDVDDILVIAKEGEGLEDFRSIEVSMMVEIVKEMLSEIS